MRFSLINSRGLREPADAPTRLLGLGVVAACGLLAGAGGPAALAPVGLGPGAAAAKTVTL
jgi:hypothetical protein